MAKGASQSQAGSLASAGRSGSGGVPRGAGSGGASGMRRRRVSSSGGSGGAGSAGNMLRFYTDDAPGLKITPTMVLVMSVCFIGFVTALHVAGKLYHYKSASA